MPYEEVMSKFKKGLLHSGSKRGAKVSNRKQAIAIMMSEKRAAGKGKKEYQTRKGVGPSPEMADEMMKKSPAKKKHSMFMKKK